MTETPMASANTSFDSDDPSVDETTAVVETGQSESSLCEDDYAAIADAVMETERGRWFLKEYARRNRNADTETVLSALERLEKQIGDRPAIDDSSTALLSHNVIDLAEAITQVKREVQDLGGDGDTPDHFNSATSELEAIVAQTETATGEILESAEKIQEVIWTLREAGADETQCDIIESKIIDVYTACSFQDLTGQRSNKVVRLVSYVEKRVATMMDILGLTDAPVDATNDSDAKTSQTPAPAAHQEDDTRADAHLLNGPALDGAGIEQDGVDALFGAAETSADSAEGDEDAEELAAFEAAQSVVAEEKDSVANADEPVDIFTDEQVVELHDAEILERPADDSLMADAVDDTEAAPDIFDVEHLHFDGPDLRDNTAVDDGFGGNLVKDPEAAADRVLPEADPQALAEAAAMLLDDPDDNTPSILPISDSDREQDIFDVDDFIDDALAKQSQQADDTDSVEEEHPDDITPPDASSAADEPEQEEDGDELVGETDLVENDNVIDDENVLDEDMAAHDDAQADDADPSEDGQDSDVPYTDEERIALFS